MQHSKQLECCTQLCFMQSCETLSLLLKAERDVSPVGGCRGKLPVTLTLTLFFLVTLISKGSFPSQLNQLLV